jgi:hypothetical protein
VKKRREKEKKWREGGQLDAEEAGEDEDIEEGWKQKIYRRRRRRMEG